jgi:hypothetical protein
MAFHPFDTVSQERQTTRNWFDIEASKGVPPTGRQVFASRRSSFPQGVGVWIPSLAFVKVRFDVCKECQQSAGAVLQLARAVLNSPFDVCQFSQSF